VARHEWHVSATLAGLDVDEMVEQPCLGVQSFRPKLLSCYCPQMRLHRFDGITSLVVLPVLVIAHPPHHLHILRTIKNFTLSSNAFLES
jgi:hypothetical protein